MFIRSSSSTFSTNCVQIVVLKIHFSNHADMINKIHDHSIVHKVTFLGFVSYRRPSNNEIEPPTHNVTHTYRVPYTHTG